MSQQDEQRHADFAQRLDLSHAAVLKVADYLTRTRGISVVINRMNVAPSYAERHDYYDSGDLHVLKRVEVKHTTKEWTSREDFPFVTVFVTAKDVFDRCPKGNRPWRYWILNRDSTCAIVVPVIESQKFWSLHEVRTKTGGTMQTYECPISETIFLELNHDEPATTTD